MEKAVTDVEHELCGAAGQKEKLEADKRGSARLASSSRATESQLTSFLTLRTLPRPPHSSSIHNDTFLHLKSVTSKRSAAEPGL